jgi:peptidoglycan/xylan/chitin deacetylase (PgdA/CDA1 family)
MYFLMTIDVESHSIPLNRDDLHTVKLIHEEGLPGLLGLLSKHDISSTFYFTGKFCEESLESVELVKDHGHEIGCHGYEHSPNRALDLLTYEEQKNEISKAKTVIESIAGRVTSFRAPALRMNKYTIKALEDVGFTTDSSICSQRFDGPFTFGAAGKLRWLFAPRKPYMLSHESPTKEGGSKILEIPISAFILPFIGTTMRISPLITKKLSKFLYFE